MAFSHAEVAAAFARGERAREGSNLKCIRHTSSSDAEFQSLTDAISYSTQIARRVVNKFTGKPEMWITSRYYSQSTARHKRHLYEAYRVFCEAEGYEPVVYESAGFLNRTNPVGLGSLLNNATYQLWEVDRPRTRDATRRGVLSSRLHRLNHAVHNLTNDRDPQFIANDEKVSALLRHADEHKHQLQHWLMLPTDEMRATVKAYLTLNEVPRIVYDTSTRPR